MLKIETDIKRKEENKMKKWLSVLLAALMLLAMAGIAGAEENAKVNDLTVNNLDAGVNVKVYKLIEMVYDVNGDVTGIKWTSGVAEFVATHFRSYADNAELFTKTSANQQKDFYNQIANAIQSGELELQADKEETAKQNSVKIANVEAGNYIVLISGGVNVYSPMAASIQFNDAWEAQPASVDAKKSTPELDKTINKPDNPNYQIYDTVKIGDTVHFDIEASVPEYPNNAINHEFVIGDVQSNGLTYAGNLKVWNITSDNGVELEKGENEDYTVEEESEQGKVTVVTGKNTTEEGIFNVIFNVPKLNQDGVKKIRISYDAVVNENVEIGTENNKNTAHLKYSINPYQGKDYGFKDDKVKVYTYGIKVVKYAMEGEEKKPLSGAEFRLYTALNQEENDVKLDSEIKMKENGIGQYRVNEKTTEDGINMTTSKDGTLWISGLKDGVYYLKEIKAPAGGYTKLANPVTVKIEKDSADNKKVTNPVSKEQNATAKEIASVPMEVENKKGSILPSTGGMGTTIFMVAGIGVMACAVAALMLVLKRQKKNEG